MKRPDPYGWGLDIRHLMALLAQTEGFSEDAARLATLGCTYLGLAEVMGNYAARQHLHREMTPRRAVRNGTFFTDRWRGYREAYYRYRKLLREFYPVGERR